MLSVESVRTKVVGTGYTIEYAITQNGEEEEPGGLGEYGIRCKLYESETAVALEEVKGITINRERVKRIVDILEKHQVFPAHVRDVIEDFLIIEFEEKKIPVIT